MTAKIDKCLKFLDASPSGGVSDHEPLEVSSFAFCGSPLGQLRPASRLRTQDSLRWFWKLIRSYRLEGFQVLHYLECRPPPCSLTDPLAFFKKQAEGLQLRANLVDFGLYLASDLVFHFSYRPLFLKYSSNINFEFLLFLCIQRLKQYCVLQIVKFPRLYLFQNSLESIIFNHLNIKLFQLQTLNTIQLQTLLLIKIKRVCN
ncbi:Hypothetical_protein [Hexamita inflata]|uniref:Hypothetical_protein n=1 Tax=Hexamita inflata TaxID=28002 RepID=A0AA86Q8V9_9EUKA|nr:Hypothetical protein HINF_LOCUS41083 [Hexamita inflata]